MVRIHVRDRTVRPVDPSKLHLFRRGKRTRSCDSRIASRGKCHRAWTSDSQFRPAGWTDQNSQLGSGGVTVGRTKRGYESYASVRRE